jgi:hypothetical protein
MKRLALILGLLVATMSPLPASAATCEAVHEWHGEVDMTKGRTDGMVYGVDHSAGGCRLIMTNLSPAGIGEAQGNAGQAARCARYGREDTVRYFAVYGIAVNADDVKVSCRNYGGPD